MMENVSRKETVCSSLVTAIARPMSWGANVTCVNWGTITCQQKILTAVKVYIDVHIHLSITPFF